MSEAGRAEARALAARLQVDAVVSHGTVIARYAARVLGREAVEVWRALRFADVIAL